MAQKLNPDLLEVEPVEHSPGKTIYKIGTEKAVYVEHNRDSGSYKIGKQDAPGALIYAIKAYIARLHVQGDY